MMRSLWISKTGMEAQQTQLDHISNNLANTATNGYKKSHAVFEDLVYQNLRQGRAVALEGFVRGSTQAPEPLGEYGVRTIYRQPIVRDKLFVEAILGYGWPRVDPLLPREGSVGTGLSIDMPFGKKT